jgi:hypothetical protein
MACKCTLLVLNTRIILNRIARFLLARLHVDSLLDKRNKQKVLSTLDKLSKGGEKLYDTYSEAIKRIDGRLAEDRSLARRALSWISYAQRLLTTTELCHALAIQPSNTALNNDNIDDVEDVISVCAGLVTASKRPHFDPFCSLDYCLAGIRYRIEISAGIQKHLHYNEISLL